MALFGLHHELLARPSKDGEECLEDSSACGRIPCMLAPVCQLFR